MISDLPARPYLARLGLDQGKLVVFDSRSAAAPLPARCFELDHQGRRE